MGIRSAFAGFVAGMGVGKYWLRHEGAKPSSGRAWLMACLWALVTVFLAAMIWLGPMGLSFKDNLFDNALLFVRNLIVICLMVRIGLWSGFRQSEETAAPP
jgi:hypothetical protein